MLGRVHEALPTSITIGIKPLAETLAEADEYLGRGFRVLKVKIGDSLEEDLERLAKLRERVGTRAVDPRRRQHRLHARGDGGASSSAPAPLDIEFVEQPVTRETFDGIRRAPAGMALADRRRREPPRREGRARHSPAPRARLRHLQHQADEVRRRLAGAPHRRDRRDGRHPLMWGCMDESRISIAAALHAAFASPATRYLDLDGSLDLARDVVSGGFTLEDGVMRTTDAPGLGVIAGLERTALSIRGATRPPKADPGHRERRARHGDHSLPSEARERFAPRERSAARGQARGRAPAASRAPVRPKGAGPRQRATVRSTPDGAPIRQPHEGAPAAP